MRAARGSGQIEGEGAQRTLVLTRLADGDGGPGVILAGPPQPPNAAPVANDVDFSVQQPGQTSQVEVGEDEVFTETVGGQGIPIDLLATDADDDLTPSSFRFDSATVTLVGGNDITPEGATLDALGISFNSDTGAFTFDPRNVDVFQALQVGESARVEIGFTVTDSASQTDTGTVTFQVRGENDAPVANEVDFSVQQPDQASPVEVAEDEQFTATVGGTGVQDIPIDLLATDADDVLTPSSFRFDSATVTLVGGNDITPEGATLETLGISFDPDSGDFTFDPSNVDVFQALQVGESARVQIGFTVTDSAGQTDTGTVTFQVRGENDAPVANDVDFSDPATFGVTLPSLIEVAEDEQFTATVGGTDPQDIPISLLATDADDDLTPSSFSFDSATVTLVGGNDITPEGATLDALGISFNSDSGDFTFDPSDVDVFQALADGESARVEIGFTVTDGAGQTDIGTVTFQVRGGNDAPVIDPITAPSTIAEDSGEQTVAFTATDADDVLSPDDFTVTSDNQALLPNGGFAVAGDEGTGFTLTYAPAENAFGTANVTVAVRGVSQTFTVTVNAVNDAASISGATEGAVTEDNAEAETASGQLQIVDPDTGEAGFRAVDAAGLEGVYGDFTFDAGTGNWTYTLDNADPDTNALAAGQQVTDTLEVTSLDGTASETITVTITGANDAPVTGAAIEAQAAAEGEAFSFTVPEDAFADVDAGDVLTLSATGLPDWLSFDGGTFSGTPENDDVGTADVTVIATDQAGATAQQTFTITVENVNDAPVAASTVPVGEIAEDAAAPLVIDLDDGEGTELAAFGFDDDSTLGLASLAFTDNAVTISIAGGASSGAVGGAFTLADAGFSYDAESGVISIDPSGFAAVLSTDLDAGETATVSVPFTLTDPEDAVSEPGGVLTFTVIGADEDAGPTVFTATTGFDTFDATDGDDLFIFNSPADGANDTINGFGPGDVIRLNFTLSADRPLIDVQSDATFVTIGSGTDSFTLNMLPAGVNSPADFVIEAVDTDDDGMADAVEIRLAADLTAQSLPEPVLVANSAELLLGLSASSDPLPEPEGDPDPSGDGFTLAASAAAPLVEGGATGVSGTLLTVEETTLLSPAGGEVTPALESLLADLGMGEPQSLDPQDAGFEDIYALVEHEAGESGALAALSVGEPIVLGQSLGGAGTGIEGASAPETPALNPLQSEGLSGLAHADLWG